MLDRTWINLIFSMGKHFPCNFIYSNNVRSVHNVHELHAFKFSNSKIIADSYKRGIHHGHGL
jgi:hypothetical protein